MSKSLPHTTEREESGHQTRTEKIILTIAGFDPSSGAGVTADLAVIAVHRLFGTSCITALTVQSTLGVKRWRATGADLVRDTLECLADDLMPSGVKLGMLADAATAQTIANFVRSLPSSVKVVLDPLVRSSSGTELLEQGGVEVLQDELMPRLDWVTPNIEELAILTGQPCGTPEQVEQAARALATSYPGLSVAATGGHLPQPDDCLILPHEETVWLRGKRKNTRATHGTGCAFSTALLCRLVQGVDPIEAARQAKEYVAEAMARAAPYGAGRGPMNLYWPLQQ